jgi:hypothetical protein
MTIQKRNANRYYDDENPLIVISNIYFHQLYITKQFRSVADDFSLRNLSLFFEVMKRLDKDDKVLIYEKYFKYATLRISSEPNSNIYRKHTVKHVPNYEHAQLMDISLVKYNKLLRRAMTNYLKILISLKDKKEDENDKREN